MTERAMTKEEELESQRERARTKLRGILYLLKVYKPRPGSMEALAMSWATVKFDPSLGDYFDSIDSDIIE